MNSGITPAASTNISNHCLYDTIVAVSHHFIVEDYLLAAKKREASYQKWQNFKEHQKDERHAQLRKKLALQHELIKARDERHLQLILQQEQRLLEAREQQKAAKLEREAALVQHCKEELVRDKKENLAKESNEEAQADEIAAKNTMEMEETPTTSSMISDPRALSVIQSRGDEYEQQRALSATIDEDGEDEDSPVPPQEEDGPAPHKDRLYQMFGKKDADYFLYPRIEAKKMEKMKIPPSIRRQGGRAGADTIWSTLRDKSSVKLKRADSLIPQELTDAYGAFVRECLTNNKTVAARSFYSEEGIPENERIQDKSYREKMKELRHHMALMYRSAQTNEDKTAILMFNNPIPDFSDSEGIEGPKRYWPSWLVDQEDEEEEEEPEYKKWLKEVPSPWPQHAPEELPSTPPELKEKWKKQRRLQAPPATDVINDEGGSDSESCEPLPDVPMEKLKDKTKKLTFLTEEDATCEGQFRKKFEKKEGPPPYVPGTDVMKTAGLPIDEKRKPGSSKQKRDSKASQRRLHTAPATIQHGGRGDGKLSHKRQAPGSAPWQPLSMGALNDYKPATVLFGEGDFSHGQEFMWKPVLAAKTSSTSAKQ
ncbi:uncharacterized protein [Amphiura filiformis]|uniref:uncharacterized protein isoform X2 n=1 Tax=Amphiura filiformis TaxID=82378 RepID=UPI003B21B9BA